MQLLLDSHVLLWWLDPDGPLTAPVRALIAERDHEVAISAASIWELCVKQVSGRLTIPDDLLEQVHRQAFEIIDITAADGVAAAQLPMHHRDPFDRMLVAQAKLRALTLVTADRELADYGVPVVAAR